MAEASNKSPGRMMAAMLAGSWHRSPTAFECSAAEMEEIAPRLLSSGVGALSWRRVRHSSVRTLKAAEELHQAYRHNIIQAVLKERIIEKVITLLRSAGIESILVKGWAVAQIYPEHGLRPYGDIDLCVRLEQFAAAEIALKTLSYERYEVDLHCGFAKFGGATFEKIYSRSQVVRLGETDVRVPSLEDHLRILSIHMLREGAWRPLWLCDIAAAVESLPADFDWDCCLSKSRRQADWILCAIKLAQQLLGAEISSTPAAEKSKPLPRWFVPTILKEWESRLPSMAQRHRAPLASYLRRPASILKAFRHRWPNPIEATISVRGSFNDFPRLPFQLGNCLARTAKFTARLPKL